jgi:hypothetical protein
MASAIQSSVTSTGPAAGAPGLEYDIGFSDVVSKAAAEAIPFGAYVVFTAEGICELPDSLAEITANDGGVALIDNSKASGVGYVAGDPVRVLVRGRVWVATEGTVAQSNPAFVRAIATPPELQGAFRADADTTDAVAAPGCNFFIGCTGAGLAVVTVNHPKGT